VKTGEERRWRQEEGTRGGEDEPKGRRWRQGREVQLLRETRRRRREDDQQQQTTTTTTTTQSPRGRRSSLRRRWVTHPESTVAIKRNIPHASTTPAPLISLEKIRSQELQEQILQAMAAWRDSQSDMRIALVCAVCVCLPACLSVSCLGCSN